jgi:hypothetical protein
LKFKKKIYYQINIIGLELEGVITCIVSFGFIIELEKNGYYLWLTKYTGEQLLGQVGIMN